MLKTFTLYENNKIIFKDLTFNISLKVRFFYFISLRIFLFKYK